MKIGTGDVDIYVVLVVEYLSESLKEENNSEWETYHVYCRSSRNNKNETFLILSDCRNFGRILIILPCVAVFGYLFRSC